MSEEPEKRDPALVEAEEKAEASRARAVEKEAVAAEQRAKEAEYIAAADKDAAERKKKHDASVGKTELKGKLV